MAESIPQAPIDDSDVALIPTSPAVNEDSLFPRSMSGTHSFGSSYSSSAVRLSRDEMNLAEFPLTVLSKRVDPSLKTLEFHDFVKGKNGEVVNRSWIITGADKFGLPTSSDDEVLLGLLKLTADDGLRNRKILFTRYELLKILRWTTEGRSYTRLQNALDRLSGVRIKATNAFYDNENKLHSTKNFGIIDEYEINDGRDTRPSFFTWSDVLFKSFQVGFIKKLDLNFYLDLNSAVSKRLYRYLDKHFWYRSRLQVNLFTLAHEKVGISRNYKFASSLRQQLEPALEELIERGMLAEFHFIGKGASTEVVLVAAYGARKSAGPEASALVAEKREGGALGAQTQGQSPEDPYEQVVQLLVNRGLGEKQIRRVIIERTPEYLQRVRDVVAHFDVLVATKSQLVSKSPCGFLYRAIEKPFDFVLPSDRKKSREGDEAKVAATGTRGNHRVHEQQHKPTTGSSSDISYDIAVEAEYVKARNKALEKILGETSQEELAILREEVGQAMAKLRAYISPQRFEEAVQHAVEQRTLEKRGFPDFDRWVKDFSVRQGKLALG
jgi:plasmid replication initiation protein